MTRVFLVRHAEPEASWGGQSSDPGLSVKGRGQAEMTALALEGYRSLAVVSSPMLRCRQTAEPYAARRGVTPTIEPRVSEIVAPPGTEDRPTWLQARFPWRDRSKHVNWAALEPGLHEWRRALLAYLLNLQDDTVLFTHFIGTNVACGAALGVEDTIVCSPAHGSITELDVSNGALKLIKLGAEMASDDVR